MTNKSNEIKHGLRERIKNAKSETEVKALLSEGATYPTASDKTKRQWNVAASNWTAPAKAKVKEAKVMPLDEVAKENKAKSKK